MKIRDARSILLIIGAILILVNAVWIILAGNAIIISSYSVASTKDFNGDWGRIVFGIPSMYSHGTLYIWLFLAALTPIFALMLVFRRETQGYEAPGVLILSLISVVMGGGFIIGMILAIIGTAAVMENKPLKESFLGRIIRAARLDSSLYDRIKENTGGLASAVTMIVFLNVLSGWGNGFYVLAVNKILDPAGNPTSILLNGDVPFDMTAVGIVGSYIGLAIAKWLIFSIIMYFCIAWLGRSRIDFATVGQAISFAYAPIALQLFMPLLLFNSEAMLKGTWPITFYFVTNIWMGIALALAIRRVASLDTARAFGVTIFGSVAYYVVNYAFIQQNFPTTGIRLDFGLSSVVVTEAALTIGVLLGLALGAFRSHEH
jgi:hypothetical protein